MNADLVAAMVSAFKGVPTAPIHQLEFETPASRLGWERAAIAACDIISKGALKTCFCQKCGNSLASDADLALEDLRVGLHSGCWWRGQPVKLPPQALMAVHTIASGRGRIVATEVIRNRVGCNFNLGVVICQVRKAFKKVDQNFDKIENHWGMGYKWKVAP